MGFCPKAFLLLCAQISWYQPTVWPLSYFHCRGKKHYFCKDLECAHMSGSLLLLGPHGDDAFPPSARSCDWFWPIGCWVEGACDIPSQSIYLLLWPSLAVNKKVTCAGWCSNETMEATSTWVPEELCVQGPCQPTVAIYCEQRIKSVHYFNSSPSPFILLILHTHSVHIHFYTRKEERCSLFGFYYPPAISLLVLATEKD